jgi:drug/metabolite transporter superfamily protein YnfA
VDGHRPDRFDWFGAAIVGVGVIFFSPRPSH